MFYCIFYQIQILVSIRHLSKKKLSKPKILKGDLHDIGYRNCNLSADIEYVVVPAQFSCTFMTKCVI